VTRPSREYLTRYFTLLRRSIIVSTAVVTFASCSGTSSGRASENFGIGSQAQQPATRGLPVLDPRSTSIFEPGTQIKPGHPSKRRNYLIGADVRAGLIYVSDSSNYVVNIYPLRGNNQQRVGQITGLSQPQGLATDDMRNLFIANTTASNVLVFAPGAKPILKSTLTDVGQYPVDVAVDRKTGEVAVTNIFGVNGHPGSVSFYKPGATSPYKTLSSPAFLEIYFDAYDGGGNLYIDGTNFDGVTQVGKIAREGKKITSIEVTGVAFPGGIEVDGKGNILMEDQSGHAVDCYASIAPYAPCGSTPLTGSEDPVTFALVKHDRRLYTADAKLGVASEFRFPSGGGAVNSIQVGGQPNGVATVPATQP
jgi:hypothetical protein